MIEDTNTRYYKVLVEVYKMSHHFDPRMVFERVLGVISLGILILL